jgi:hypothetical protein
MAASVHVWLSGKENVVSKEEQKSRSESGDAAQNNLWAMDRQDAISAMTLFMPGT